MDRYLGWPGQAPSYAIGQRIWQQLRDEMITRGVPLKEFHSRALDLGGLPLDVLRSALLGDQPPPAYAVDTAAPSRSAGRGQT